MNTLIEHNAASFDGSLFHVSLTDGTMLSFPIVGNWRLENASLDQLNNVEIDDEGLRILRGIRNGDVDSNPKKQKTA